MVSICRGIGRGPLNIVLIFLSKYTIPNPCRVSETSGTWPSSTGRRRWKQTANSRHSVCAVMLHLLLSKLSRRCPQTVCEKCALSPSYCKHCHRLVLIHSALADHFQKKEVQLVCRNCIAVAAVKWETRIPDMLVKSNNDVATLISDTTECDSWLHSQPAVHMRKHHFSSKCFFVKPPVAANTSTGWESCPHAALPSWR